MNTDVSWPDRDTAWWRVLKMQTKLHQWAGESPERRFDDLFNLVADPAFLMAAWDRVRTNTGARSAGVDGMSAYRIEAERGVDAFLTDVREKLKAGTFRPEPVRERLIPKAGGKVRKLGIPTITDRVVQAALKQVLEPIFEADFHPCSYGFRPRRRAQDAIAEIHLYGSHKYEWVLEADIEACFDNIDHTALMARVRRRVGDKRVLALVKMFLKSGVLTQLGTEEETLTGTPQGGILSPLLANIALSVLDDWFVEKWQAAMNTPIRRKRRHHKGLPTWRLVRYADDFVVMVHGAREDAAALQGEIVDVLAPMGLRLSMAKTAVVSLNEGFDFLGFRIQRRRKRGTDRYHVYTYPSKKALASIVGKIRGSTRQASARGLRILLLRVNAVMRGWCNYFRYGVSKNTFTYVGAYSWYRVVRWIRRHHHGLNWKELRRRVFTGKWGIVADGIELFEPAKVPVTRYRYRGAQIPTPWTPRAHSATA